MNNIGTNLLIFSCLIIISAYIVNNHYKEIKSDLNKM